MSDTHLSSVLGILRLLKRTEGLSTDHCALNFLQSWVQPDGDEEIALRIAVYVQSQIAGAATVIEQSDYVDEGKAGLLETINGLRTAFSLSGMHTAVKSYVPLLDSALSQFAILVSIGGPGPNLAESKDVADLIKEVDELYKSVLAADMDEDVRAIAKKHLHVLLTLLRNLNVMGVEAAMAAYAELVIRLNSAGATASTATQKQIKTFWPTLESWAKRLNAIQKLYAAGAAILEYGKPLLTLIKGT